MVKIVTFGTFANLSFILSNVKMSFVGNVFVPIQSPVSPLKPLSIFFFFSIQCEKDAFSDAVNVGLVSNLFPCLLH